MGGGCAWGEERPARSYLVVSRGSPWLPFAVGSPPIPWRGSVCDVAVLAPVLGPRGRFFGVVEMLVSTSLLLRSRGRWSSRHVLGNPEPWVSIPLSLLAMLPCGADGLTRLHHHLRCRAVDIFLEAYGHSLSVSSAVSGMCLLRADSIPAHDILMSLALRELG